MTLHCKAIFETSFR